MTNGASSSERVMYEAALLYEAWVEPMELEGTSTYRMTFNLLARSVATHEIPTAPNFQPGITRIDPAVDSSLRAHLRVGDSQGPSAHWNWQCLKKSPAGRITRENFELVCCVSATNQVVASCAAKSVWDCSMASVCACRLAYSASAR